MTIKASDEWKEHALHPEKSDTGETPESMAPAERATGDPDAVLAPSRRTCSRAEGSPAAVRVATQPASPAPICPARTLLAADRQRVPPGVARRLAELPLDPKQPVVLGGALASRWRPRLDLSCAERDA